MEICRWSMFSERSQKRCQFWLQVSYWQNFIEIHSSLNWDLRKISWRPDFGTVSSWSHLLSKQINKTKYTANQRATLMARSNYEMICLVVLSRLISRSYLTTWKTLFEQWGQFQHHNIDVSKGIQKLRRITYQMYIYLFNFSKTVQTMKFWLLVSHQFMVYSYH